MQPVAASNTQRFNQNASMPSVMTMRNKYRQLAKRQHRLISKELAPIPEDKSCREWRLAGTACDDIGQSCCDLINQERVRRNLAPLQRSPQLHRCAQAHAGGMAKRQRVVHSVSCLDDLKRKLKSNLVGENVQHGESIESMHNVCVEELEINRSNLLGRDFSEFGVGIVIGADGKLYMVQYFR